MSSGEATGADKRYPLPMKVVAANRRARFDYEIVDTVEAGMILTGQEVKSCRLGHCDLRGSYVSFLSSPPRLKQMTIQPYASAGPLPDYNPLQDRGLLLKKSELEKLQKASEEKGFSIIPLEVLVGRYIKLRLAVARGRKQFDKRQKIKERDVKRRLQTGQE